MKKSIEVRKFVEKNYQEVLESPSFREIFEQIEQKKIERENPPITVSPPPPPLPPGTNVVEQKQLRHTAKSREYGGTTTSGTKNDCAGPSSGHASIELWWEEKCPLEEVTTAMGWGKSEWGEREFAIGGMHRRYQYPKSVKNLIKCLVKSKALRVDVGGKSKLQRPRSRDEYVHELVFDFDADCPHVDPRIRKASPCKECWDRVVANASFVTRSLREQFAFQKIYWFYRFFFYFSPCTSLAMDFRDLSWSFLCFFFIETPFAVEDVEFTLCVVMNWREGFLTSSARPLSTLLLHTQTAPTGSNMTRQCQQAQTTCSRCHTLSTMGQIVFVCALRIPKSSTTRKSPIGPMWCPRKSCWENIPSRLSRKAFPWDSPHLLLDPTKNIHFLFFF